MKICLRLDVAFILLLAAAGAASAQQIANPIAFTLAMDNPSSHTFHVTMHTVDLPAAAHDFKMPVWTPGYYGLLNFGNNLRNFQATDGAGHPLQWTKAGDSDWHVEAPANGTIDLAYDIYAPRFFVASPGLDATHGYVMGAGVFLYPNGQIKYPVQLTIDLNPAWKDIATGLDPVSPAKPHVYNAADFDVLYDSPILMGNLETLPSFEVRGVKHDFIGYNLGQFDHAEFMKDLQAIVEAAVAVIGKVPYNHYTFIAMGPGQGGIEHLNSTSFGFTGINLTDRAARNRELSFLAHEYFHNFNVKRIRPMILGPFDYDHAAPTNMLWVSEGFTVYYEYMTVARAGLMTQDELLGSFQRDMATYENSPGRLFESATQASVNSWNEGQGAGARGAAQGRGRGAAAAQGGGVRRGQQARGAGRGPGRGQGRGGAQGPAPLVKTISYYNKGPVLGLLLDFKIRHETQNKKSLDSVMRLLYQRYYEGLKRGWTDEEFQKTCEEVAGTSLAENFAYASTTEPIDYAKYLAYAGLELAPASETENPFFGAIVEDKNGKPTVTAIDPASPAAKTDTKIGDTIGAVDGKLVTSAAAYNAAIAAHKPGDTLSLDGTAANGDKLEVDIKLAHEMRRTFAMHPIANPDALQAEILKSWMANSPQ